MQHFPGRSEVEFIFLLMFGLKYERESGEVAIHHQGCSVQSLTSQGSRAVAGEAWFLDKGYSRMTLDPTVQEVASEFSSLSHFTDFVQSDICMKSSAA